MFSVPETCPLKTALNVARVMHTFHIWCVSCGWFNDGFTLIHCFCFTIRAILWLPLMPVKQPWPLWVNISHGSVTNTQSNHNNTKHNESVCTFNGIYCIDGLVQYCSNSIAVAMELLQSCAKPWVLWNVYTVRFLNNHPTICLSIYCPSPRWNFNRRWAFLLGILNALLLKTMSFFAESTWPFWTVLISCYLEVVRDSRTSCKT